MAARCSLVAVARKREVIWPEVDGLAGGSEFAGRDAPQTAWRKMRQPRWRRGPRVLALVLGVLGLLALAVIVAAHFSAQVVQMLASTSTGTSGNRAAMASTIAVVTISRH